MSIIRSVNVYVAESPGKGRGVFASMPIRRDEIIEACPFLCFAEGEEALHIDKTPLENYYFRWKDGVNAVLFGYGSLYNHSYSPSAVYRRNYESLTMEFVALRDISADEEVTINYNGRPDCRDPLWFPCEGSVPAPAAS